MADEAGKPDVEMSNAGEYTSEQLDEMLEHFIEAKRVEADPKKLAMLRKYAQGKQKEVLDLFDVNNVPPPKSLKDLKKTYAEKVAAEQDD